MTNDFMERVQLHERTWGMEHYPNRPALNQILASRVVAFWRVPHKKDERWVITVHEDTSYLEKYFLTLVLRAKIKLADERRFVCAYEDKVKLRIKGVRLIIEKDIEGA
jgi:hypothetical protein